MRPRYGRNGSSAGDVGRPADRQAPRKASDNGRYALARSPCTARPSNTTSPIGRATDQRPSA
jgi:hypothetical protein